MVYNIYLEFLTISSWSWQMYLLCGVVLIYLLGGTLGRHILRLVLVYLLIVDLFRMTRFWACFGDGGMDVRVRGTERACLDEAYHQYLIQNFRIDSIWILAAYAVLVLFIIWPWISRIFDMRREMIAEKEMEEYVRKMSK